MGNSTLALVFLGAIIIIPFSVLFGIMKYANNKLMKQFGDLAIKYGSIVEAKKLLGLYRYPFITTQYNSRDLHIGSYSTGMGKRGTTYTYAKVSVRHADGKIFDVYKESFNTKLEQRLGDQDIQLNDPEFDKNFSIRANDESFIKAVLSDDVKEKFFETLEKNHFASVQLKDDQVQFIQYGMIHNKETRELFESMIELLYVVADQVDEVSRF